MFKKVKNSKNLGLVLMLCMASLFIDCDRDGGTSTSVPTTETCQNGLGVRGACTECNTGFRLEVGLCNPIPGARCADGVGSAGACISCNEGFVLAGNSCFAQVRVTFDLNEGAGALPPSQTVTAGQIIPVPDIDDAVRTGFIFLGWSTLTTNVGANFVRANAMYTIPSIKVPEAILTLYATWGEAYRVTYNLNGGGGTAVEDPMSYLAGTTATIQSIRATTARPANASASPTDGFFGWGVTPDGIGQTYNAGANEPFASNTSLYALWYYPVTYNCGDGTATEPANFPNRTFARTGEVLTNLPLTGCSPTLAEPARTFVGWSTTGSMPYITTMPNGPITLKPVYAIDVDANHDGLIEISTAEQLNNMRYNLEGTSYKVSADDAGSSAGCPATGCRGYELVANIDLGNTKWGTSASFVGTRITEGWEPIGACGVEDYYYYSCGDETDASPFTATFEGSGFVIHNLYINRSSNANETGFFGAIAGGTLNHVTLQSIAVRGDDYTGGLVGAQNGGTITNSYITGVVRGAAQTGGLVGANSGTISNSYATGTMMGGWRNTGGLVGANSGTVTNSYITGVVTTGGGETGGLVGFNSGTGIIINSYATGTMTGNTQTGGLVGENRGAISNSYATEAVTGNTQTGGLVGANGGTISNSYATGTVRGFNYFTGGLVGDNAGTVNNSYATGAVTGSENTGGLVGDNAGTVNNSYATGAVTGSGNTGGLVGVNASTGIINNSYATGSVTGHGSTGGLVGIQYRGRINNSYATGSVTGQLGSTGGLVGTNSPDYPGTINNSYWDTTTTGSSVTGGVGNNVATGGVTGLPTGEMQAIAAVTGPPALSYPSTLNGATPCYKLTTGEYPQLYTWDASTSACTTTPLFGPNGN